MENLTCLFGVYDVDGSIFRTGPRPILHTLSVWEREACFFFFFFFFQTEEKDKRSPQFGRREVSQTLLDSCLLL